MESSILNDNLGDRITLRWFGRWSDWIKDDLRSCGVSEFKGYVLLDLNKLDSNYEVFDILKEELKQKVKYRIRDHRLKNLLNGKYRE